MTRLSIVIVVLAGLLGLVLGALSLSIAQMAVTDVVVATGPAELTPGETAALRVVGTDRTGHEGRTVAVDSARWSGGGAAEQALAAEIEGAQPALVRFRVPEEADGAATVTLTLRVAGGAEPRRLAVPVRVAPPIEVEPARPRLAQPVGEGGLRVSLLPEARVLSYRFEGAVFVRVMDADGAPAPAEVVLSSGKDEPRSAPTGPLGVAALPVRADRPHYALHAAATGEGGRSGEVEEYLRPVPRGHRLRLVPRVVAPGARFRLAVEAHEAEETLHCDVLHGGRIHDSFTLRVAQGAAAIEREAPRVTGRHSIQCAPFWRSQGEAFATAALVVSERADAVAALAEAVRPTDHADARWLREARNQAAALDPETRERVAGYLAARLTPDYTESAHLASTLEADRAALAADRALLRGRLTLALGIAVPALLAWLALVVTDGLRARRRRSAVRSAVLGEGGGEVDEGAAAVEPPGGPLAAWSGRARRLVPYAVAAVLLVVNVVAVLWLVGTVGR